MDKINITSKEVYLKNSGPAREKELLGFQGKTVSFSIFDGRWSSVLNAMLVLGLWNKADTDYPASNILPTSTGSIDLWPFI